MKTHLERCAVWLIGQLIRLDDWLVGGTDLSEPLDPRAWPWTAPIAANWQTIRAELDADLASGRTFPLTDDIAGSPQGADGVWRSGILTWFGRWHPVAAARYPRTTALLRDVPDLQIAGFTILGPATALGAHRGPVHALRYQVGLIVDDTSGNAALRIGDTTLSWSEGSEAMFDDRSLHEAWNTTRCDRYVFFVQTRSEVHGLRGAAHRCTQWMFGTATSGALRRAVELTAADRPAAA